MLQEGGARNEQATLTSYQLNQRKQSQPDCLTSGTTNDSSIGYILEKGESTTHSYVEKEHVNEANGTVVVPFPLDTMHRGSTSFDVN